MEADHWTGCYEGGWQGVIVPEAFSHPAKFSYALTGRMFRHAIAQGWLRPGDVVADPFGGVGCGGIVAAYSDIQWVGCELEARFVDLAKGNFELHRRKWEKLGSPQPQIIQGDSRQLASLIGQVECVVSSPPFMENNVNIGAVGDTPGKRQQIHNSSPRKQSYGHSEGQLGAMKPGTVAAVISSPPYAETLKGDGTQSETAAESRAKRVTEGGSLGQSQRTQGYGNKGNLGNLKEGTVDAVVGSPPFHDQQPSQASQEWHQKRDSIGKRNSLGVADGYGETPGNLGNLKEGSIDAVVSSPPFEESNPTGGFQVIAKYMKEGKFTGTSHGIGKKWSEMRQDYAPSKENIGNDKGPTFWQAAREIVEQCHKILRPGGHCLWVLKAFVRKGKRVDFPSDWRRLCESVGFTTVCVHHAMLVKEETHNGLFGEIKEKTEKKSFFRRLAESKGSPAIDYEVVLCMERTEQGTLELQ